MVSGFLQCWQGSVIDFAAAGEAAAAGLIAAPLFAAATNVPVQAGHLMGLPSRFSATVRLRLQCVQAIAGMMFPSEGLPQFQG
jgi:hypothetical protein